MSITNKFIPIYEYSKRTGISQQNIYRKIREGKVPKENFKVVEKIVKRILIDDSFKIETKNVAISK